MSLGLSSGKGQKIKEGSPSIFKICDDAAPRRSPLGIPAWTCHFPACCSGFAIPPDGAGDRKAASEPRPAVTAAQSGSIWCAIFQIGKC